MTLRTHRILAIASVLAGALAYRSLAAWNPDPQGNVRFQDWLFSSVDAIPQIYYGIAAALVYRKRKAFRRAMRGSGSAGLASLPLAVGAALFVWGHYVGATDLLLASFLSVTMGLALLWFGTGFAAAWAVPCVVLAFAFPIPAVLTNQVFYSLRLWTADQVARLLTFVDFPAYHEGNVIHGPEVVAQVIDSCSGLRAMEMITLAAFVFVQWTPAQRLRGWLLIALAPLIAYGFNLLRVAFIIRDPTTELSATHTVQGWTAFFGALVVVVLVDRGLGRLFAMRSRAERVAARRRAAPRRALAPGPLARPRAGARCVATATLLAALCGVSVWMPRWQAPESGPGASASFIPGPSLALPLQIGDWHMGAAMPLDRDFIWTLRFAQYANRPYRRSGDAVELFIGYGDRRDRNSHLLSRKNALPGRGWEVEGRSSVTLEGWDARATRVLARSGQRRIVTYHWYEGLDSVALEALRALFATDRSPLARSQRPRVIRIGTSAGRGAGGEAEADRRLRAFAAVLAAALAEAGLQTAGPRRAGGVAGPQQAAIEPEVGFSSFWENLFPRRLAGKSARGKKHL